jgi:hypothetical protein
MEDRKRTILLLFILLVILVNQRIQEVIIIYPDSYCYCCLWGVGEKGRAELLPLAAALYKALVQ